MVYDVNGNAISAKYSFPFLVETVQCGLDETRQQYQTSKTIRLSRYLKTVGDSLEIEKDSETNVKVLFYDSAYGFLGSEVIPDTGVVNYSSYPNCSFVLLKVYINGQTEVPNSWAEDHPVYIISGISLAITTNENVIVASADCTLQEKESADFVCNGTDDTQTLQHAIFHSYAFGKKTILLNGYYILNSLAIYDDGSPQKTCLYINADNTEAQFKTEVRFWQIEGNSMPLAYKDGAIIMLGDTLYNSLSSSQTISMIRSELTSNPVPNNGKVSALALKNLVFRLPGNGKKVTCVDLNYTHAVDLQYINCMAVDPDEGYGYFSPTNVKPVPVPVEGCNGILGTFSSNWNTYTTYRNIECYGFYVGFDVSGDHVLVENASMKYCWYGFTFQHLKKIDGGTGHPVVCNNLLDEHNMHMPLFDGTSNQPIYITGMNLFFAQLVTFEGHSGADYNYAEHDAAVDVSGETCGFVHYVNLCSKTGGISRGSHFPAFFKSGGHNVRCYNDADKLAAASTKIRTYEPNYMQQCFDTTLNKLVIYDGSKWVDTFGTAVYQ